MTMHNGSAKTHQDLDLDNLDINEIAIITDVDMTLVPSTSTILAPQRRDLFHKLHDDMKGALAISTGRPAVSVDATFGGALPASVEHHSAIRLVKGGTFIEKAPRLSQDIHEEARDKIGTRMHVFNQQSDVLGDKAGVFIERKEFSLALIFAAKATPQDKIDLLREIGDELLLNIGPSHRISVGSDAVEIVPHGVDKGQAVRDFMATAAFQGRRPIFIGDSNSDRKGMEIAAAEFNGCGIAVRHGIADANFIRTRMHRKTEVWHFMAKLAGVTL